MEYKKVNDSEKNRYMDELLALSRMWANEHSCPSYYANEPDEFIDHDVYIVIDEDRVVAYGLGKIEQLDRKTSYNEIGEKAFYLDELYVAAGYRNRGIGNALYRFMEEDVREKVDVISVIATSNEYKKLLNFYIEDLDMKFNHAQLTKRMHE